MKNLIQFLSKNSFIFLFLFLQFIAFSLLVQNNSYQSSKFFNSSNFLIGNLYTTINHINEYFSLKGENEELAMQNAELQSYNVKSFVKLFGETVQIHDTAYFQQYTYTSAKVINNSTNRKANYITIDKGSISGIEAGMAVISARGVVGKIINVSDHFSSVMSVLNSDSKISGKIKKNGEYGPIVWESGNNDYRTGQMLDIPNHVDLEVGDTILTSGFSDDFPEGVEIGTIKEFNPVQGGEFYDISINFSVNYKTISHVYIVKYLQKEEQKELESLNPTDDK